MPVVPPCSLCKIPEKVRVFLDSNKKPFLKYSIFIVLIIEWFSLIYQIINPQTKGLKYDTYLMYWYPLLTQLILFVLFFSFYLWKERLHFCYRKSATTFYLAFYYFLGFVSVLFCVQANIYYSLVNYSMLLLASLLFIVSFFKSED